MIRANFSTQALNPNATPFFPRHAALNPNAAPFFPRHAPLNPNAAAFVPRNANMTLNPDTAANSTAVNGVNSTASKSNFFTKFKAMLCKVAQAPVTFASKVGRALKKTVEQVATWKMFRKVLVRVICVATVIGVSAAVSSMAANPLLGGAIGAMLCAAGQELLGPSADAFVNELFPD
jgi:hypothetical protein